MKYTKICPICDKTYTTYRENQKTCSKQCMGLNQTGSSNPNYGNTWSEDQKKHLSNYQKSIGSIISNRVTQDWKENTERREQASILMSKTMKQLYLDNPGIFVRSHSETTRSLIGLKSKAKFTPEFLIKQRETMISLGYWKSIEELTEYEIYFKESNWIERMWDIVPSDLLNEYGIFNAKSNTIGCVRDHMFGRREGFKLKVPPILLRHPANCQIILHSDNVKKAYVTDISKSLEQLFNDIQNYSGNWAEQEKCLVAITTYLNSKEASHASNVY